MSDNETDAFSTIMAFEQILEVMPDDLGALEAVAQAYDELGDQAQAKHYTMRLTQVLMDAGDVDQASGYIDKLRMYAGDDAEVRSLIEMFENLTGGDASGGSSGTATASEETGEGDLTVDGGSETAPAVEAEQPPPVAAVSQARKRRIRMSLNVADEMAFAWNLLQTNLLTQEEYAGVVQDLTDLASANEAGTISVLHILQDHGFKGLEKMVAAVARSTGVPIVDLHSFVIQRESVTMLPFRFIQQRGVLPFDRMGTELLVVCLNPYDESLRRDTETLAECRCHWFMTLPSGFDDAIQIVKGMQ